MIYLGSDHGGVKLKEIISAYLKDRGLEFYDCGTFTEESVDYPDVAEDVCKQVVKSGGTGVLVCGTGVGMSIAANKIKGIRAAVVSDGFSAKMAKMHNDANVLCLGQRVLGNDEALFVLEQFLGAEFEGGRHKRRVDKISGLEE